MRRALTAVTAGAALLLSLAACDTADEALPETICGTPVSPDLSGPLLRPGGKIVEGSRVDRQEARTAPCVLSVDGERALGFRFAFHNGSPGDLLALSRESTVIGLTEPARVDLGFEDSVLGNDGATATALCKTAGGDHFTLTVQAKRAYKKNRDLRPAVEAFMRTYMTETLKTLNCG
ncbi:hypothetical protein [Streptomyces subrutilus]|uniref:DUF3558 domain-containing protein n=1 Tax=Streptomyces subrutilus TaxID=36818 RepID=A0A1E5PX65_9ACTN|nr:hypothetical protein [Streptomyces subrutilus]OEJ34149.1 hypothetical protein BGK67_24950 [Streptomyces subrutilus]